MQPTYKIQTLPPSSIFRPVFSGFKFKLLLTLVNDVQNISEVMLYETDAERIAENMSEIRSWIEANKPSPNCWAIFSVGNFGPDEF